MYTLDYFSSGWLRHDGRNCSNDGKMIVVEKNTVFKVFFLLFISANAVNQREKNESE